ncbi:MAG TPA: hypothetical protein VM914_06250 [Pyrinomonadaceae bacterium]|jgi:hypothetical protein|nr:hypothetical protein [Pyrinomonadaceae bacterium]
MRGDFKVTNVSAFALAAMLLTFGVILAAALPELRRGARQDERGSDSLSKVLGEWEGESVCVGKNRPACKNEHVIYHITKKDGDEADAVTMHADKVVNGKPEEMGVLDCKYDAAESSLTCEFNVNGTHGVFEYAIDGDEMEGTLKLLPAGTLGRRIKVRKLLEVPPH